MGRLGIHSLVWTDGQTQEGLESAMEKSAACGFQLIEFGYLLPQKFDLDRLSQRARALDLDIAVTMGLPPSADVSSTDPETVRQGEAVLASAIAATRDMGGKRIGGILYSAHGKYATLPNEEGRKNSIAAVARAADLAKAAGVDMVIEVANRFETNLLNTVAQGLDFIRATGSDHVKLHLDTFHMNIEEANPAAAIRLAADRIGYVHIGESNRGYLGDGVVNFDRIFEAFLDIGYQQDMTFESFSKSVVDEGMSLACGLWRETWSDNIPLAEHALQFITLRMSEAARRHASNSRP